MVDIIDPFLSGSVVELSDTEKVLVPRLNFNNITKTRPYVVGEEDTIQDIAAREFGGNVSVWYTIFEINDFEDPLELPIGEIIKLPVW